MQKLGMGYCLSVFSIPLLVLELGREGTKREREHGVEHGLTQLSESASAVSKQLGSFAHFNSATHRHVHYLVGSFNT